MSEWACDRRASVGRQTSDLRITALVAADAQVTLKRTIDHTFPAERLISRAGPLERLRPLEQYRENRG